ncbi:MAG TPA: twin-arginine translocase TatA/TatE family subunit [Chloroflexia bacterium]|nr:twin-arginine translocase TatA/TatE family subunit [Chloroflexia bacterium]
MEIFGIGLGEIMIIALVALIVLGPDRLPEVARSLGRGVAEIRRATEPARSAWSDLTTEINKVTAPPPSEKTGNPWTVHPIMQNMTPEEREKFMQGGEMPPAVAEEMAQVTLAYGGSSSVARRDVPELDYPMPHSEMSFQPAPKSLPPLEELEYPSPGSANGQSTPPAV